MVHSDNVSLLFTGVTLVSLPKNTLGMVTPALVSCMTHFFLNNKASALLQPVPLVFLADFADDFVDDFWLFFLDFFLGD